MYLSGSLCLTHALKCGRALKFFNSRFFSACQGFQQMFKVSFHWSQKRVFIVNVNAKFAFFFDFFSKAYLPLWKTKMREMQANYTIFILIFRVPEIVLCLETEKQHKTFLKILKYWAIVIKLKTTLIYLFILY